MAHVMVFQLLCGCFSAFVAGKKGRSRLAWFAVGLLVPIIGVALAWWVSPPQPSREVSGRGRVAGAPVLRRPPKRCNGSYISDCLGCPHFAKPLFDATYSGPRRGQCELFGRELVDKGEREGSRVLFDDGRT